ncbi:MAG: hypothetical protein M3306_09585, partial [Actinomycetota bacterium]|nr:hypothetical protein [Actinomycetota bacterium]
KQAVLSPKDVIDVVLPVLTGRRLSEENSDLWGSVKKLMRARDMAVHQGELPDWAEPERLVAYAKKFIEWTESLPGSCGDG